MQIVAPTTEQLLATKRLRDVSKKKRSPELGPLLRRATARVRRQFRERGDAELEGRTTLRVGERGRWSSHAPSLSGMRGHWTGIMRLRTRWPSLLFHGRRAGIAACRVSVVRSVTARWTARWKEGEPQLSCAASSAGVVTDVMIAARQGTYSPARGIERTMARDSNPA